MSAQQTNELREAFAFNVRKVRRRMGLSQEALADYAGFGRSYLSEVEAGKRNVSLDNVEKLARVLGVHPIELLLPMRADARGPTPPASSSGEER